MNIIFFHILLLFLYQNCMAQLNDSIPKAPYKILCPLKYSSVTKSNPFTLLWGPIPLTSELRVIEEVITSGKQSLQIGVSYLNKSLLLWTFEDSIYQKGQPHLKFSGYRLQVSYKLYLSKRKPAPKGLYISPHISFSSVKISYKHGNILTNYIQGDHFNTNLLFGYQLIARNGITFDFFSGPGYKKNTWEEHKTNTNISTINIFNNSLYNSHLKFTLGFNAGMAF